MLHPTKALSAPRSRRGSALLMAFLMIILLFGIVFQLWFSTNIDLRVADNEVTATQMDLAIESALQEVYDRLKTDGEAAASGAEGGAAGGDPASAAGAAAAGGGGESQATDSREDSWGKPQRTTINEIDLRIVVQDEDSKINVLGMLTEDEDMAREHFDRVVRVLDLFREGSTLDVDHSDAVRMAEEIRRHLSERPQSVLPRPEVTSHDEERPDVTLPLGLREFVVLEGFDEGMFRDGRDEHGDVIHSLGAFLTVTTSLTTRGSSSEADGGSGDAAGNTGTGNTNTNTNTNGTNTLDGNTQDLGGDQSGGTTGGAQGGAASGGAAGGAANSNFGVAINLNTAPVCVLKSLFDDRDMNPRFWDAVVEYRNLEDEEKRDQESEEGAQEPVLDEYGNEVVPRQVFDSVEELTEVDGYDRIDAEMVNRLAQFVMTESQVFSIYVTAFQRSKRAPDPSEQFGVELASDKLIGGLRWRTVRSIVWRYKQNDEVRIVPLTRWEALDYIPIEVVDYPPDDR